MVEVWLVCWANAAPANSAKRLAQRSRDCMEIGIGMPLDAASRLKNKMSEFPAGYKSFAGARIYYPVEDETLLFHPRLLYAWPFLNS